MSRGASLSSVSEWMFWGAKRKFATGEGRQSRVVFQQSEEYSHEPGASPDVGGNRDVPFKSTPYGVSQIHGDAKT